MNSLKNEWAIITGASKGLGRSIAHGLAKEGMNLILIARTKKLLVSLANELKPFNIKLHLIEADVTKDSMINKVLKVCHNKNISILINNAGIVNMKPLDLMSKDEIAALIDTNLLAPIKITRAIVPLLKKKRAGTIVNINSTAGRKPALHHTIYCATKYGLDGFSRSLQLELNDYGIRIINIYPGRMQTELHKSAGFNLDTSNYIPPDYVANLVVQAIKSPAGSLVSEVVIDRSATSLI